MVATIHTLPQRTPAGTVVPVETYAPVDPADTRQGTRLALAAERVVAGMSLTEPQAACLRRLFRELAVDVDTARPWVLLPHEEAALAAAEALLT